MTTRPAPAPIFDDITTATPVEIDGHLARLDSERSQLGMRLTALRRDLGEAENIAAGYGRRFARKVGTVDEITRAIAESEAAMLDRTFQMNPLGAEFTRRGGWSRWYLVSGGHLHYDVSGSRCSRIPTTDHFWVTDFSGKSNWAVIALASDRVCTNCFPDAPVTTLPATSWLLTPTEAERAARAEAAQRTLAARRAAQITAPDGGELRTADGCQGDLIKTEVAASRRALAEATDLAFYGASHPDAAEWRETVVRMIAALAHRNGVTEQSLRDGINAKVAKKAKREQWTVQATI